MDDFTTPTFVGSLSLYRCYGCTFQILRKREEASDVAGHYRLTHVRLQVASPAMP